MSLIKETYLQLHKEYLNKNINLKSSEFLFDKLVKVMSYIEYNSLNDNFFDYIDKLEDELGRE